MGTILSSFINISFGIPYQNEKVRSGQVKAVVYETERTRMTGLAIIPCADRRFLSACQLTFWRRFSLIPSQRGKGLATRALKNCIELCAKRFCTAIMFQFEVVNNSGKPREPLTRRFQRGGPRNWHLEIVRPPESSNSVASCICNQRRDLMLRIVGVTGFEPMTSCSQGRRASRTALHPVLR